MNNTDRIWLARIDERTQNIWRVLDEQEDSINKKLDRIIEHNAWQNGILIKNTIWRKVIIGVGGSSLVVIIGWLLKLTLW